MRLPPVLVEEWRHESAWLAELPCLVAECADEWGLILEEPLETPHSLVVLAGEAVLKLNAPSHFEADHEADALERWGGDGAVRLLRRDDRRRAFLVERCRPGTPLSDSRDDEIEVVCGLLPRLAIELDARDPFRLLADEGDRWLEEVPRRYAGAGRPFEHALVSLATHLYRTVDRSAALLANQDLHAGNVLTAEREPWLVVDPKPLAGELEANAVGLLRNAAWHGGTRLVRRWLDALANLGFDRVRARDWGVAHALAWGWDAEGVWIPAQVEAARAIAAS